MPINIVVKTKIKVNGQEYESVDDMPEEIRAIYEKVMGKVDNNHGEIIDAVKTGLKESRQSQSRWSISIGPKEFSVKFPGGLKSVYRRIWFFLLAGVLSFFIGIAIIQQFLNGKSLTHSPFVWFLAVPIILILLAVYTSARHWHCQNCGASLPTRYSGFKNRKCPICGWEYDL